MDEVLIDASDSNLQRDQGKGTNSPISFFNAETEIADVFGNTPWEPKEVAPPPAKKEVEDRADMIVTLKLAKFEIEKRARVNFKPMVPAAPMQFQSGGFEDAQNQVVFGQRKASSFDCSQAPPFSSRPAYRNGNVQREVRSSEPTYTANTRCFSSSSGFGGPPPRYFGGSSNEFGPPLATTDNAKNTSRSEQVSGFGCSNEAIARLPGRSRGGRSRRGNSGDRRRRSRGGGDLRKTQNEQDLRVKEVQPNSGIPSGELGGFGSAKGNETFGSVSFAHSLQNTINSGTNNGNSVNNSYGSINNNRPIQKPSDESRAQPAPIGGRRSSAFGEEKKGEEVPAKKRCGVLCMICGKSGHSSDDCYRNPKNMCHSREAIRCYNCNERGHMAVRCNKPPMKPRSRHISSGRTGRKDRKTSTTENGQKENTTSQGRSPSELKGLEVICKLMKDKHLREEAAKKTPQLFDEMLIYMIEHVSLTGK